MERVEVEASYPQQSYPRPRRFTWKGRTFRVEAVGRRWEDENGQHMLVMADGGQVFHLRYVPGEGRWYLLKRAMGRTVV